MRERRSSIRAYKETVALRTDIDIVRVIRIDDEFLSVELIGMIVRREIVARDRLKACQVPIRAPVGALENSTTASPYDRVHHVHDVGVRVSESNLPHTGAGALRIDHKTGRHRTCMHQLLPSARYSIGGDGRWIPKIGAVGIGSDDI